MIRKVTWIDSCVNNGWRFDDDFPKPSKVKSIGYIIKETKKYIVLTSSKSDVNSYVGPMAIPRSAIIKMEKI